MSYDIYGNPLHQGHCEVHPHVREEYPCSVCMQESNNRNAQQQSESEHSEIMRLEHELELSQTRISELERELEIHKRHTNLVGELTEYMVKRGIGTLGSTCTAEIVRLYEELEDAVAIWKKTSESLAELRDKLYTERDELAATVERLRDASYSVEAAQTQNTFNKAVGAMQSIIEQAPQQNLNAVKRAAILEAVEQKQPLRLSADELSEEYNGYCEALYRITEYANTKYPSGKDGGQ